MILTTHIAIAAAVTKPLLNTNPIFPFAAALASHYLADAIPHWDYKLSSLNDKEDKRERRMSRQNPSFVWDIGKMGGDALLGSLVVLYFFPPHTWHNALTLASVIIGAILPDLLQGVYLFWKNSILGNIQTFHDFFHTKIKLGPYPLVGVPFQIGIFLLSIWFLR